MTKPKTEKQIISDHMSELGRRGGAAGKGTAIRRKVNKQAALARWREWPRKGK